MATRKPRGQGRYESLHDPLTVSSLDVRRVSLRKTIRQRRSAVAMDGETRIDRETFYRILQRTLAISGTMPFRTLPWKPHLHLAIFVHRIDDLPTGLYFLVRDCSQRRALEGRSLGWGGGVDLSTVRMNLSCIASLKRMPGKPRSRCPVFRKLPVMGAFVLG